MLSGYKESCKGVVLWTDDKMSCWWGCILLREKILPFIPALDIPADIRRVVDHHVTKPYSSTQCGIEHPPWSSMILPEVPSRPQRAHRNSPTPLWLCNRDYTSPNPSSTYYYETGSQLEHLVPNQHPESVKDSKRAVNLELTFSVRRSF